MAEHAITRPTQLLGALIGLGYVPAELVNHSRRRVADGQAVVRGIRIATRTRRLPQALLTPDRAVDTSASVASLTPLLQFGSRLARGRAAWWDLYDDWSIAPEIALPNRLAARRNYAAAGRATFPVSVNSAYMQAKVGAHARVIPNGTDPKLASLSLTGDDRPRLILLGSFRKGRTDYSLAEAAVSMFAGGDVIVAGPGAKSIRIPTNVSAQVVPYMSWNDVCAAAGSRTVALIPHIVNDYTVSQDPIKLYYFLALGIPVVLPRLLLPPHVDETFVRVLDYGGDLRKILASVMRPESRPSSDWRKEFATLNSWESRAAAVLDMVSGTLP